MQLGDVDRVLEDEGNATLAVEERRVGGAPVVVALLPADRDAVVDHRQHVGAPGLDHATK